MKDKKDLRELLLDMGMRPSDVLFSDAVFLVEGLADETFLLGLGNTIGRPLTDRHVKLIRANGKDRGRYKIEFWGEVAGETDIPFYLMFDQNANEEAEHAIEKGLFPQDRTLILRRGDLEDYYSWPFLKNSLSTLFDKDVPDEIPVGTRVAEDIGMSPQPKAS